MVLSLCAPQVLFAVRYYCQMIELIFEVKFYIYYVNERTKQIILFCTACIYSTLVTTCVVCELLIDTLV